MSYHLLIIKQSLTLPLNYYNKFPFYRIIKISLAKLSSNTNVYFFVAGEGGEGEEPPEDIQEDEDGDEEDDDGGSRHSSESADMMPDSRIPSPITILQEDCNTQPIDLANSELLPNK